MNCKSDIACEHCTDIHKYKDCTMKHDAPKATIAAKLTHLTQQAAQPILDNK